MPGHGGNAAPRATPKDDGSKNSGTKDVGPKTPSHAKNGKNNTTQIELTPIESLLFFNMVRFNGNHEKIDWAQVAAHSNLKNAASAKVRFRQILKKHGLMAQAPATPRSQAQKRKALMKSEESLGDEEDGDSANKPSPGAPKSTVRKQSAPRAVGSRAKRMKASLESGRDQDDDEAVVNSASVAPAPAPKTDTKTEVKAEAKTEPEPGSDNGIALLNDDGVTGAIDGTASASPHDQGHGQAPSPQVFDAGGAHLLSLGHHHSALSANIDDPQMMQLQFHHSGMAPNATIGNGSFGFGQQMNPSQLSTLRAQRDSQLQPQQLAAEQLQEYQLNRFQAPQMFPYQMAGVPGGNLPFSYMAQMQMNEHFPVGAYDGVTFFNQAQLSNDVGYGHADDGSFRPRVDGQDEWDLDRGNTKREITPEIKKEAETECESKDGHEDEGGGKPQLEEI